MARKVEKINKLAKIPKRPRGAHKGDFGRVLVVGGCRGMIGAVGLAANAALRGGAGLVSFAAPDVVQKSIATTCPCATSVPLASGSDGELADYSVRQFRKALSQCDVLALGPGMGVGLGQQMLVRAALDQEKPLVLDADGLNNLVKIENWPAMRRCPLVITPHPGEFGRLRGMSTEEVQADREQLAVKAMHEWEDQHAEDMPDMVCALKGKGTIVTDGRRVYVNTSGNPGMATGGSGDILTGLIGALIGQGLELFDAACLGVFCHGRAGDLAAKEFGEVSLIASDLLDFLPQAIGEVSA